MSRHNHDHKHRYFASSSESTCQPIPKQSAEIGVAKWLRQNRSLLAALSMTCGRIFGAVIGCIFGDVSFNVRIYFRRSFTDDLLKGSRLFLSTGLLRISAMGLSLAGRDGARMLYNQDRP